MIKSQRDGEARKSKILPEKMGDLCVKLRVFCCNLLQSEPECSGKIRAKSAIFGVFLDLIGQNSGKVLAVFWIIFWIIFWQSLDEV